MSDEFPRRIRMDKMTPEELGILNMIDQVEKLGAHPFLTDVVVLLGQARDKLADWVDLQIGESIIKDDIFTTCSSCGEYHSIYVKCLIVCSSCNGEGKKGGVGLSYTCPECKGKGKVRK